MAVPATYDIAIYQGDDFLLTVRLRNYANGTPGTYLNLTGATVAAKMYDVPGGTLLATFICTLADQTATPGQFTVELDHTTTAALAPTAGTRPVWDVEVTDSGGKVTTYLAGQVTVTAQVTP